MNRETAQESLRRTLWRMVAVIAILGAVSYGARFAVWTVAGFLALGMSLRLLHTPRPWLGLAVAALSNHLFLYDWMVLVPAGVVVARHLLKKGVDLPAIIVSIVHASFVQLAFGASIYRRLGFTVQITSFVLIFVGIVAVRHMRSTDGAALVTKYGLETTI